MRILVTATQAEMDEMEMTPNGLAAAVLENLNEGVSFDGRQTELSGFDVIVKVE